MTEKLSLEQYFQEVNRYLPCSRKERARLINQVRRMIEDLRQEHPNLEDSDILEFLGQPEDLAKVFTESMEQKTVIRYQDKKRHRKKGLLVSLVLVIIALTIFSVYVIRLKSEAEFTQEDTVIIIETQNLRENNYAN